MSVLEAVRQALTRDPNVTQIDLVGSRANGRSNSLSDYDIRITARDYDALVEALPKLTESLEPLVGQWDPLSDHAVYMVVLPGAIKVDLFPGDRPWAQSPPWDPSADNLGAIDGHFWDWILWLGSKQLGAKRDVVAAELEKLQGHLLGPLGAPNVPESIADAVAQYVRFRMKAEGRFGVKVDRRLGDEVTRRLRDAQLA